MVAFSLPQIGLELGGGAVIGAVIGFAAKKIAKIVAIIIGLELALFKFLETRGILQVNWDAIVGAAGGAAEQGAQVNSYLMSLIATLPIGAGFTGGFLLAFKKA